MITADAVDAPNRRIAVAHKEPAAAEIRAIVLVRIVSDFLLVVLIA
jgi:hypothetical protein